MLACMQGTHARTLQELYEKKTFVRRKSGKNKVRIYNIESVKNVQKYY